MTPEDITIGQGASYRGQILCDSLCMRHVPRVVSLSDSFYLREYNGGSQGLGGGETVDQC